MGAFLDGDVRAFETLFRQLAPRVASVLTRVSGDRRLAEDLTQNVFLKVYRARSSYQRAEMLTPWGFAIARNLYIDHVRRMRRRPEDLSEDGTLPELADQVFDPQLGDENLSESLESLPASQRHVLLLLKVEGLSVAETASNASCAVPFEVTAHNQIRRASRKGNAAQARVAAMKLTTTSANASP